MTGPLANVPVGDEELVARFVLVEKHVKKDGPKPYIKAPAFLPFRHVELSVTRHQGLAENELWALGQDVANARAMPLVGRGDISARTARAVSLEVEPSEGPGKGARNHANIVGWPSEKAAQLVKALVLAAAADFVRAPNSTP